MIDLQPVKGTRDFYPAQMRERQWLFNIWREVSLQFGFEEYDACVLEHEELYVRKAGDEITEQLYNFKDKGDRGLSLRPEMTPSLARMVMQQLKSLVFPLKWYTVAQCFRYERMTKGRRREHFQWNVDVIGQASEVAEIEVFCMLITALQKMGLNHENTRIFINDRRLLNHLLTELQVPNEKQLTVMIVIDKRDKLPPETFRELLRQEQLQDMQINAILEFLSQNALADLSPSLQNCPGGKNLAGILDRMQKLGFGPYLQFDSSIVRGLSYYTGTVFEINHPLKNQRAISGGGRYDSLLSTLGGEVTPAFGFGFGDVVIMDMLKELEKIPSLKKQVDVLVVPFSAEQTDLALQISGNLRKLGKRVESDFSQRKIKKALQYADDIGASQVILLFPEELAQGQVVVRDMASRQQNSKPLQQFL